MSRTASTTNSALPLIVHLVYRFGVGGLENGIVNLINHMPEARYRHAIVSLTDHSDFTERLWRSDVQVIDLHKRRGHDLSWMSRFWRVLRQLRPDIVHSRNLAALEGQVIAAAAGVAGRVHGEHGRDVFDLQGKNLKYNLLRKAIRPLVHRYITVSRDLQNWLQETLGVDPDRISQIYNGVESERFHPRSEARGEFGPPGFAGEQTLIIGSVGRMEAVKDFPNLVRAFLHLLKTEPGAQERLRLVIVGNGPSRNECLGLLAGAGAQSLAWLPGERSDVDVLMRGMDLFVLASLGEGISNTILEAMASGLPVVATRVGGNLELVGPQKNGLLVPPADPVALAQALRVYWLNPQMSADHGRASRVTVESRFSIPSMVNEYLRVYDHVLKIGPQNSAPLYMDAAGATHGGGSEPGSNRS
ncbi:MAG: TIGR03088 family PEP-CTERM/XrtA system glycosyltransferase [Burkholderiales bacterium]